MNYDLMKKICLAKISDFETLGEVSKTPNGIYIHKSNPKSKVLGIAHLDTVLSLNHFHKVKIDKKDIVINAQLDDRLGVYVMLDILPKLGIDFDLLLTEGEELGLSTAMHFNPSKEYNWMFSFDRHGDDVVLYQYEDNYINTALKDSKFRIGKGTFSDIAFLEHLGIKGFNIGTGYEGEHSDMCYADISILNQQIARFLDFYRKNKDIHFPHTQTQTSPVRYWKSQNDCFCCLCYTGKGVQQIDDDLYLCDSCFNEAEQCQGCQGIYYGYELSDGLCDVCLEIESE